MNEQAPRDDTAWFCRQIRTRSREHREAMPIAAQRGWLSIMVGILRQELDSMIRVIFLLEQQDPGLRAQLLEQAVSGEIWKLPTSKGKLSKVTDRQMVDMADLVPNLQGWTQLVYQFGCSFIHLSDLHDYLARDPFRGLRLEDRQNITTHLRRYHGGNVSADSTFDDIAAYMPKVLNKIASNLEYYLNDLEREAGSDAVEPRS